MATPPNLGHPESKMPGMPPSAMRGTRRGIMIVPLGSLAVILMFGVAYAMYTYSTYTPPSDCAEQTAEWSVDETSPIDAACR
jgi:hypothetical protein